MKQVLDREARRLGLSLSERQLDMFSAFADLLEECGKTTNLTAIRGDEDVAKLHFADSLSIALAEPLSGKSIIDVGSGAGFPALPLAIYDSTLRVTALDSVGKKADFMAQAAALLGLKNAECLHARAEELALKPEYRQQYDIAVSRAVAPLNILCELCLPFVRQGGLLIAMKTPASAEAELEAASNAISELGSGYEKSFDYMVADADRRLIFIRRVLPVPDRYPRRFSRIKSSPL